MQCRMYACVCFVGWSFAEFEINIIASHDNNNNNINEKQPSRVWAKETKNESFKVFEVSQLDQTQPQI